MAHHILNLFGFYNSKEFYRKKIGFETPKYFIKRPTRKLQPKCSYLVGDELLFSWP